MTSALLGVDPLAAALAAVAADENVLGLLGGYPGDPLLRVDGTDRAPYPRLQLTAGTGGNDGDLRLNITRTPVQIAAIGDLDGRPGSRALRDLLYTAVAAVARLPLTEVTDRAAPVWTAVRAPGSAVFSKRLQEQPVWTHTLMITGHPGPAVYA